MMKISNTFNFILVMMFLFNNNVYSDGSGWIIKAHSRENYNPVSMANGMIGLVVSKQTLKFDRILLNGAFDIYGSDQVPTILNGINFANIELSVDGIQLSDDSSISEWQQQLDMYEASLATSFKIDNKIDMVHTVYALRHLPFTALITVYIKAHDDVIVKLKNTMTSPEIYRSIQNNFEFCNRQKKIPLLNTIVESPTGKVKLAAASTFVFNDDKPELIHEVINSSEHSIGFELHLKKGQSYSFDLIGNICSSAHFQDPLNEAKRLTIFASLEGNEKLIKNHQKEWKWLWESDIAIEGDEQSQIDVRFALFNLYSFIRAESAYSIPPMGLSNVDYYGHIFWDAELWMYPPLLMLQPEMAKSMLEYRFKYLDAAKQNARSHGFKGAMFPWESDDRGEESTPTWALTGPFEHHITACVGIAFWNYYCVARDIQWLREIGYPVLKEVADFWISRVEAGHDGKYHIRNVVGADEYAENVDDNAFTNGAAIIALKNATKAAKVLNITANPDWNKVANNIDIPKFNDGTTKEYDVYNGQVVKQADVNLLAYPLNLITDENIIRKDLAYYAVRMDENGPAMSHSILAVICSRLGEKEKAFEYFQRAYVPNKRPPFGVISESPNLDNPYFATGAGGMLQVVLAGFGGLDICDDGIRQVKTSLPVSWNSLIIKGIGREKKTYIVQ